MKTRTSLFRLGALAGILLILAYMAGAFRKEISTVERLSWSFDPETLQSITLIVPPDTLQLTRNAGHWTLTRPVHAVADSVAIRRLQFALRDLEFSHVVSSRPERYVYYGVDTTAPQLLLSTRKASSPMHLFLGRPGPDTGTRFIRLAHRPEVWLARSRVEITVQPEEWIDRTVLNLPPEHIQSIDVVSPEFTYRVLRDSAAWRFYTEEGKVLQPDSLAFHTWIRRFHPLRADAVVLDSTRSPIDIQREATYRMTFTLTDGSQIHLYGLRDTENLYLTADGRTYIYRLPAYRAGMFWTRLSSLTVNKGNS